MNLVVFCTCPDERVATGIAAALVEERLAACVSQLPGLVSTYRWEGRVSTDTEVLLLIKTTGERFPTLEERILALHPYSVPEIIAVPVAAGHQAYLDWLAASVTPND